MRPWFRFVAVLGLLFLGDRATAQTLEEILTALDNDDVAVREQASQDLLQRLCEHPDVFPDVRTAINAAGTPPEARARAQQAVAEWIHKLPIVQQLDGLIKVDWRPPIVEIGADFPVVEFGCDYTVNVNDERVAALLEKWDAVRSAISRGDPAGAIDKANMMQMCLESLTAQQALDLGFVHPDGTGVADSDRDFLLAKLQQAQQALVQFGIQFQALVHGTGALDPHSQEVLFDGPVDLGKTILLSLEGVQQPGSLSLFLPAAAQSLVHLPPGFVLAAPIASLMADERLVLSGSVQIGYEFAGQTLSELGVDNPSKLRIARFHDQQFELLPTEQIDLNAGRIFASYLTGADGTNPLGEFYLLRVPEPSTLALVGWGILGTFLGAQRVLPGRRHHAHPGRR